MSTASQQALSEKVTCDLISMAYFITEVTRFVNATFAPLMSFSSRKRNFGLAVHRLQGAKRHLNQAREAAHPLWVAATDDAGTGVHWTGGLGYDARRFVSEAQGLGLLPGGPVPILAAYRRQQGDQFLLKQVLELADAANDALERLRASLQAEINSMRSAVEPCQPARDTVPLMLLVLRLNTAAQTLQVYWTTATLMRTQFLRLDKGQSSLLEHVR